MAKSWSEEGCARRGGWFSRTGSGYGRPPCQVLGSNGSAGQGPAWCGGRRSAWNWKPTQSYFALTPCPGAPEQRTLWLRCGKPSRGRSKCGATFNSRPGAHFLGSLERHWPGASPAPHAPASAAARRARTRDHKKDAAPGFPKKPGAQTASSPEPGSGISEFRSGSLGLRRDGASAAAELRLDFLLDRS